MKRLPLWAQVLLAVLVFFAFQNLTVWLRTREVREARAQVAQQQARVSLRGQERDVVLSGLDAACFKQVMERSRQQELWLRLEGGTPENILLGGAQDYRLISGSLDAPQKKNVCLRLNQLQGTWK